jgi:hypothetical protein
VLEGLKYISAQVKKAISCSYARKEIVEVDLRRMGYVHGTLPYPLHLGESMMALTEPTALGTGTGNLCHESRVSESQRSCALCTTSVQRYCGMRVKAACQIRDGSSVAISTPRAVI